VGMTPKEKAEELVENYLPFYTIIIKI